MTDPGPPAVGSLFLEALRFDFDPVDALRRRADAALSRGVGGFLLFGADAETAGRLVEEIRASAGRPLWFAADLERGAGQHFRGLTTFPPPAALAHHPEPLETVRFAARTTAREARTLGLNLALAPDLDLDVEPANPIVGTRSFGPDPDRVAELGDAWIEACQEEGVAACAKHFPGHGRTTGDSHVELPVVTSSREILEKDLVPFRRVASRVACVMTAHVAFPAFGAEGPATLDEGVLQGMLRRDLGFAGLVLTDALNMSGARSVASPESVSPEVAAVAAGCDLLLYPPDLAGAIRALEHAADTSSVLEARIHEAAQRSADGLTRYEWAAVRSPTPVAADADDAGDVAAACVMPAGGDPPAWLDPAAPVAVATIWDDREDPARPPFGERFRAALRESGWTVAGPGPRDPKMPIVVLIAATPQAWKGASGLTATGRAAAEGALADERAYPIVFGHPRLLEDLARPGLCAWATEPAMERAAARRLVELARSREGTA